MENENNEIDDLSITQFCDIADANAETAKSYLTVADGNLENALQLYFSGVEITTTKKNDVINIPDDEYGSSSNAQPPPPQPQLMEEDVRAPIAAKKDILVDDFNFGSWRQPMYQQGFQTLDPFRDFSAETAEFEEDDEAWSKSKRLSELFKVPFDIIFSGTLDDARVKARTEEKWIIVNIQESSEFACQVLNRDLWSNQDVKDIIKSSFVFLQYSIQSMEGQQYKQFYQFEKYPHIALLDPRTGERVKYWDYTIKPEDFVLELTDFLSKNNFNDMAPVKSNISKSSNNSNNITSSSFPKNYDSMTEDEQIRAAIEMSMKETQSYNKNSSNHSDVIVVDSDDDDYNDDDYNDFTSEDEIDKMNTNHMSTSTTTKPSEIQADTINDVQPLHTSKEKGKGIINTEEESNDKEDLCENIHKKIKAIVKPEPTSGNITRIQFRLPDGKRIVRKFLKEDTILSLFEFIKGEISEANTKPFELLNFRDSLIDKLSQTIEEASLTNSSISVSYI